MTVHYYAGEVDRICSWQVTRSLLAPEEDSDPTQGRTQASGARDLHNGLPEKVPTLTQVRGGDRLGSLQTVSQSRPVARLSDLSSGYVLVSCPPDTSAGADAVAK